MRKRNGHHVRAQQPPPAHSNSAQPREALLQRLAAICAAPEPPEAVVGTQRGGQETVQWLVHELTMAAQRCDAAAVADNDTGAADLKQASSTLAAAAEASHMRRYQCFRLPRPSATPSLDSRPWYPLPLHGNCVTHRLQAPALLLSGSEGGHGARRWWCGTGGRLRLGANSVRCRSRADAAGHARSPGAHTAVRRASAPAG